MALAPLASVTLVALSLSLAVPACSETSCEEVVKSLTAKLGPANRDKVAQCKEEGWSVQLRSCLLGVNTEDDFTACIARYRGLRMMTPRAPARASLDRMARMLKTYHVERAELPRTASPLVPATPCCSSGSRDFKCQPDPVLWETEPWSSLGFSVDQPQSFRYSLDVIDPLREVVVRAIGDLDCDSIESTYELRALVGPDGTLTTTITEPEHPD